MLPSPDKFTTDCSVAASYVMVSSKYIQHDKMVGYYLLLLSLAPLRGGVQVTWLLLLLSLLMLSISICLLLWSSSLECPFKISFDTVFPSQRWSSSSSSATFVCFQCSF